MADMGESSRIRILGGGLVGRLVVSELYYAGNEVTLVDIDEQAIQWAKNLGVETILEDATSDAILDVTKADIWVNMLPGRLGDKVRRPLLERGATVVDLAFTLEDPREMNKLAISNGSTLVYDVGVAPGISNLWIANALALFESSEEYASSIEIRVGGNPCDSDEGWSYMAPFSPSDVIEEYERPARIRINGEIVDRPALTDRHLVKDSEVGELEAFLTDGLRSLLDLDCPNMVEYTMRWPGHIEKFVQLRESGAFTNENRERTLSRLYDEWKFNSDRKEMTILLVTIKSENMIWEGRLFDDGAGGWSSMARTTGLVTVAAVEALAMGVVNTGVHAPEDIWQELLPLAENRLAAAGVSLRRDVTIRTQ